MVANSLVRFTSLPHRAIFRILEMRVYEEWALVAGPLGVKCKEHTFSTGGKKASGCFFRKRPLRALHLLPARLGVLLCRGGAGKWDATKRTAAICNTHRHYHLPPSPAPRASRTQRLRHGSCTSPRLCRRGSRLPGSSFRMGFGRTGGEAHSVPSHPRRGGAAAASAAGRGVGAGRVPRRPAQRTEPRAQHPGAGPAATATAVGEGPSVVMASRGARPDPSSQHSTQ